AMDGGLPLLSCRERHEDERDVQPKVFALEIEDRLAVIEIDEEIGRYRDEDREPGDRGELKGAVADRIRLVQIDELNLSDRIEPLGIGDLLVKEGDRLAGEAFLPHRAASAS